MPTCIDSGFRIIVLLELHFKTTSNIKHLSLSPPHLISHLCFCLRSCLAIQRWTSETRVWRKYPTLPALGGIWIKKQSAVIHLRQEVLLLGVAHPHTMWVQSVLIPGRARQRFRHRWRKKRGDGERRVWGKGEEKQWHRKWRENGAGKVHWLEAEIEMEGGCRGGGGSCSTGYESSSSVGTQVEYFSSFIAGGPLSASVIRSVCDAQSSLLQRKQVALPYSSNLLRGCRKKEMSMSGDEPASYISSPFIPSSLTCDYHTIDSPVKQLRIGGSHLFPSLLFIRKGKRFRSLVWSRCFLHFSVKWTLLFVSANIDVRWRSEEVRMGVGLPPQDWFKISMCLLL